MPQWALTVSLSTSGRNWIAPGARYSHDGAILIGLSGSRHSPGTVSAASIALSTSFPRAQGTGSQTSPRRCAFVAPTSPPPQWKNRMESASVMCRTSPSEAR
jgi:hypothetical protein